MLPVLLLYLGLFLLFGLAMARDMQRRPLSGFFRPVMLGFIPVVLFSALTFASLQNRDEPEVVKLKEDFVSQLSHSAAGFKPEEARAMAELMLRFSPGLQCLFWLLALSALALGLRYWLASRGISKLPGKLTEWKASDSLIWLVLAPGALVLFEDQGLLGEVEGWLRDLSLNVLLVSLAIYLFQGVLVIVEKLNQFGIPKVAGTAFALTGLALSLLPAGKGLGLGMIGLGLLETWFDFRSLQKKDNDEKRSSS